MVATHTGGIAHDNWSLYLAPTSRPGSAPGPRRRAGRQRPGHGEPDTGRRFDAVRREPRQELPAPRTASRAGTRSWTSRRTSTARRARAFRRRARATRSAAARGSSSRALRQRLLGSVLRLDQTFKLTGIGSAIDDGHVKVFLSVVRRHRRRRGHPLPTCDLYFRNSNNHSVSGSDFPEAGQQHQRAVQAPHRIQGADAAHAHPARPALRRRQRHGDGRLLRLLGQGLGQGQARLTAGPAARSTGRSAGASASAGA